MQHYVVSIGSNCGDRKESVAKAIDWLSGLLDEFKASQIYETPPVGHQGSDYMNAVVTGVSDMTPSLLERELKRYEVECGRDLYARIRNLVPIDLDIVIADGNVVRPEDYKRVFFQIGYHQLHLADMEKQKG